MKLLLDENLPKRLKQDFQDFEIYTVFDKGWAGKTNGELLKLMINENFHALLTFDKNLQHQQNFQLYSLTVFIFSAADNRYTTIQKLIPKLKKLLTGKLPVGIIEVK